MLIMGFKQALVVRKDLKMSPGKVAAQVAHASLAAYQKAGQAIAAEWEADGSKKVVLKVAGLQELMAIYHKAKGLPCALIKDAAKTQLKEPAITCLGIGPAEEGRMDKITKGLKLL